MKFLLDTNVIIPAEPAGTSCMEESTPIVTQLIGLIIERGFKPFIHPASKNELHGDHDDRRRILRGCLLNKYIVLENPPPITTAMTKVLGVPDKGSNTETDTKLLAAICGNAVDFLVTSDNGIHKRAARLGIVNRVLTPEDAIATIRALIPANIAPPPAVKLVHCYELDISLNIFKSLRDDYPGFPEWFAKCQRDHRDAFVISSIVHSLAQCVGIAIIKQERSGEFGLSGKVLKICTFKVDAAAKGYRYGELLLKAVFEYAEQNSFEKIFLTCFPNHSELIRFLENFGFVAQTENNSGELVFVKRFDPTPEEQAQLTPIDFHILFGPKRISFSGVSVYIVPIQPQFHRQLFPDLEKQFSLLEGETSFGNAILKAYLSHASVKGIKLGDILLFYRSQDSCNIRTVGIVDNSLRSMDADEIARLVGQRTVYPLTDIQKMCKTKTFALLFRQSKTIPEITLDSLIKNGALKAAPQQITKVKPEGLVWIEQLLEM